MAHLLGPLGQEHCLSSKLSLPPNPGHLFLTMTGWCLPRNLVKVFCIWACWRQGRESTISFSVTFLEVVGASSWHMGH
jgi:hypothetical protein